MLSKSDIQRIKELDPRRIVEHYAPGTKFTSQGREWVCCCPFHHENEPSFTIQKFAGKSATGLPIWKCQADCRPGGAGALSLIAAFEGIDRNDKSRYKDLLKKGCELAGIAFDENEDFSRKQLTVQAEYVAAVDEYQFDIRDGFSDYALELLGCSVRRPTDRATDRLGNENTVYATDADGNEIRHYGFGANFRPEHLSRDFHLFQLNSYTAPVKEGQSGSRKTIATDDYPIFAIMYDYRGKKWGKIYQPLAQERFRFIYFGEHPDLKTFLFGDSMACNVINGDADIKGEITRLGDTCRPVDIDGDDDTMTTRMRNLIICSGLTDALNTYYKGNVNVVFLNSETSDLHWRLYDRMEQSAKNVFILFDIDNTGLRNMNTLGLKYPTLRIVRLPDDLRTIISTKGKPCKDAKDYFTLYEPRILRARDESISYNFAQLLKKSNSLMFWTKKVEKDKDGNVKKVSYSINSSAFKPFLNACGVWRYKDPDTKELMFVYIRENIIDIIDDKEVQALANKLMVDYLRKTKYYEVAIENVIHDSAKVKRDNLNTIPEIDLTLDSWGDDYDHLYFENGALRITPDGLTFSDYTKLPFQVFRDAILKKRFFIQKETFRFIPNPEREKVIAEIATLEAMEHPDAAHLASLRSRLAFLDEYGRYNIEWLVPFDKQPPFVQYLYNTCRMYWRKEKRGEPLTTEEQMEHDAHFVSKVNAIGYALYRQRTSTRPWMLYSMENRVKVEGKAEGGTGKSMLFKMLGRVRPMANRNGKEFDAKLGAANFHAVFPRRTALFHLEDIDEKTDIKSLYNFTDSDLEVKRLYKDVVVIPQKYIPVWMLSANYPVDLSNGSTLRRLYPMAMSDYYHAASIDGSEKEWKPDMEFGEIMSDDHATQQEINDFYSFMARAMGFFMSHKTRINPPMTGVRYRSLVADIGPDMVSWCTTFFEDKRHLNCYHSYANLLIQFSNFTILSDEFKKRLSPKVLRENMQKYCAYNGLVFNPPGAFKNDADREARRIRTVVWDTLPVYDDYGKKIIGYTRERRLAQCWYIGEMGKEPLSPDDIPAAPTEDPEPEMADIELASKQAFLNAGPESDDGENERPKRTYHRRADKPKEENNPNELRPEEGVELPF